MSHIIVSQLFVYPVKSCRGIALQQARVEAFGLQHDRRWMVVDQQGVMLTQRQHARMCLIQPEITGNGIRLTAEGMSAIDIAIPDCQQRTEVVVWNDHCQSCDAGDAAAHWLSDFLQVSCRLVYFPHDEVRQVDLNYAQPGDKTAFSDGFPMLLISQASLDNLNAKLSVDIGIERFRPNLVVSGCDAHAEDQWSSLQINNMTFRVAKPCSRCVIPSINIDTAEREREPLKTLASYRRQHDKVYFGQNIIAEQQGELQIGMSVAITGTGK